MFSLDQIPIIENIIESLVSMGNIREADQMQDYLLMLNRRTYHYNDLRLLSVLKNHGDWNLEVFNEYLNQKKPIVNFGPSSFSNNGGEDPDTSRYLALIKLHQARFLYKQAIQLILRHGELNHPELPELEKNWPKPFIHNLRKDTFKRI